MRCSDSPSRACAMSTAGSLGSSVPPSPRQRARPKARAAPGATPPATPRKSVKRRAVPSALSPIARPRKRAPAKPRSARRSVRSSSSSCGESMLTLFRTAFVPDVKLVAPTDRLFAQEFGCLLFAFGDARFCVRETLELVEDCVREEVRRVAMGGSRSISSRLDARGMYRLRNYLSNCGEKARAETAATDVASARTLSRPDMLTMWTENLFISLKHCLPTPDYAYLSQCRSISFARNESLSHDPKIRGTLRATLFKEWLAIPFAEQHLLALAHLTWELTGQLVQTALLCKYNLEFRRQPPSLCPNMWTNERHWLEALGHGVATAFTIPSCEPRCTRLSNEIQRLMSRPYYTTLHLRCRSEGLIPSHIYAALSKLKEKDWGGQPRVRVGLYDFV